MSSSLLFLEITKKKYDGSSITICNEDGNITTNEEVEQDTGKTYVKSNTCLNS